MTRLGRLDEAEAHARAALEHCPPGPRGVLQRCRLHSGIGRVQLAHGRLAEATASFEATLQLARDAGHRRAEAEALNSLGEVVGLSARYQEAVDRFRAALQIDRDLGDRAATGIKLANLGIAYTAIGLYRRAERHLRKALELHVATGHPGLLTEVVLHLGEVSAELARGPEDLAAARALLEQAASMAGARGDLRTELRARARLARCLLDVGDPQEARTIAEAVLARGREHGLRSAQTRACTCSPGSPRRTATDPGPSPSRTRACAWSTLAPPRSTVSSRSTTSASSAAAPTCSPTRPPA
jgi:tetratricopeptide (TPR) repeat protein